MLTFLLVLLAGCSANGNGGSGTNTSATNASAATHTVALRPSPTLQPAGSISITAHPTPTPIPTPTPVPIPTPTPKSMPGSSGQGTNMGGKGTGGAIMITEAASAVFAEINQERAGAGLPALVWTNALVQSAHKHNLAMMAANQLSHQLPNEAGLGTRISNEGLHWTSAAENIGYGFGDATKTANSLNQSMFGEQPPNDGHRLNILSGNMLVGVDVVVNPQNGQVWLTEDFAKV